MFLNLRLVTGYFNAKVLPMFMSQLKIITYFSEKSVKGNEDRIMLSEINGEHLTEWPVDGAEAVDVCPVCSSSLRQVLYEGLQDTNIFLCPWVMDTL